MILSSNISIMWTFRCRLINVRLEKGGLCVGTRAYGSGFTQKMAKHDVTVHPFGQLKSAVLILFPPSSLDPLLKMAWPCAACLAGTISIGVLSTLLSS